MLLPGGRVLYLLFKILTSEVLHFLNLILLVAKATSKLLGKKNVKSRRDHGLISSREEDNYYPDRYLKEIYSR